MVFVTPGCPAAVLLVRLSVHVRTPVLLEPGGGGAVAADSHGVHLVRCPLIELGGADEGYVDPHPSVGCGAVEAEEDAVGHGGPGGAGVGAVEAGGVGTDLEDLAEGQVLL